jgi:hypothetical protein
VVGKGNAHVHERAGDHGERAEKEVQRLDLELPGPHRLAGLRTRRPEPAEDIGGALDAGRPRNPLMEVGAKLVAARQRPPVPGERQLDRQRQEPGAHAREGGKRGAVARIGAGASEQRIRDVEAHRLKLGHPEQRPRASPVREVAPGDPLKERHISGERLRGERLEEELAPDGMSWRLVDKGNCLRVEELA